MNFIQISVFHNLVLWIVLDFFVDAWQSSKRKIDRKRQTDNKTDRHYNLLKESFMNFIQISVFHDLVLWIVLDFFVNVWQSSKRKIDRDTDRQTNRHCNLLQEGFVNFVQFSVFHNLALGIVLDFIIDAWQFLVLHQSFHQFSFFSILFILTKKK